MAWIGLHTETSTKVWVWTDGKNHGIEWGWQEPKDNQSCGAIGYHYYYERKIYSKNCEKNLFFACQRNTTEYPFIKEMMTWSQAEEYCNNGYNGLASFATWHTTFFSEQNFPIWIGLHRNGGSWKWSLGLEEDKHWNLSNPSNDTTCVTISSVKKELATKNCQTQLPFLCTKDNMVLVKENKSWEEAFEHCQGLRSSSSSKIHFNLLSVKPGDEHTYVMNKVMEADTEEAEYGINWYVNGLDGNTGPGADTPCNMVTTSPQTQEVVPFPPRVETGRPPQHLNPVWASPGLCLNLSNPDPSPKPPPSLSG
ncbi:hypothetical protein ATANTOWER_029865 [Ataeniobius toweri]|uniref:C-type lectin domain-containing protein n=1 Tax=Ataeniobius toweri TaxID=208326 RepID=A0ABU7B2G4_9TELE|nr:hypothetical protein [Ataeniobius toweri]